MTKEIDPKLKEWEQQLRALKPRHVDYEVMTGRAVALPPNAKKGTFPFRRTVAVFSLMAASIVLAVFLFPKKNDTEITRPLPPEETPRVTPYETQRVPKSANLKKMLHEPTTFRQLLAVLIDEMTPKNTIPEKKPNYPVIEIPVSYEKRENIEIRQESLTFGVWNLRLKKQEREILLHCEYF